jgi:hypothetical protein
MTRVMSGSLCVQVKKWTRRLSLIITDELSWRVTDQMGSIMGQRTWAFNIWVGYNKMGFIPLWMRSWYY